MSCGKSGEKEIDVAGGASWQRLNLNWPLKDGEDSVRPGGVRLCTRHWGTVVTRKVCCEEDSGSGF